MAAKPLDEIHIHELLLRCIVGINDDERIKKQDVIINITLYADLSNACQSDDIADTIDYKTIKLNIIDMVESSTYFLVEKLAEEIASICLADSRVCRTRVSVEKPGALRFTRSVGLVIIREQSNDA